jgi:flagellin-like hook-associated protein FlgL
LHKKGILVVNAIKARKPVDREKNITKISFVNNEISDLAIPKLFSSDTRSLGQAIRKTGGESSLLETIAAAVDVQSGILARMRELTSQSSSEINVNQETIESEFSALQEELNGTQNLLIRSVRTLKVTMENLMAADSTVRETNFAEKIATLMQNRFHANTSTTKKE